MIENLSYQGFIVGQKEVEWMAKAKNLKPEN